MRLILFFFIPGLDEPPVKESYSKVPRSYYPAGVRQTNDARKNRHITRNNTASHNRPMKSYFLFVDYSNHERIIERQNIENERQRKMADLANRRHDGGIPSDVTLRSVSDIITTISSSFFTEFAGNKQNPNFPVSFLLS